VKQVLQHHQHSGQGEGIHFTQLTVKHNSVTSHTFILQFDYSTIIDYHNKNKTKNNDKKTRTTTTTLFIPAVYFSHSNNILGK
jgi:hypothetical protein